MGSTCREELGAVVRGERADSKTRRQETRKQQVRQQIWDRLQADGNARFPYPPHGRIPNFAGAREAAERLFELELLEGARRIKVNPDAPQRPVRLEALRRGIEVYMPTPRLRGGFLCLDPKVIAPADLSRAASLSGAGRFAREVPLDEMPELDFLVVGSVAVSRDGGRCGKGEGYADLEYGILRSLGHPAYPVVTSVHSTQVVASLPRAATDLPLGYIVTPEEVHVVDPVPTPPSGIDWSRLSEERLDAMPVLRELADLV
ncbi:5-formyltetrahydrofolate cyclo-ligase [Myxococcota bacterium]|nr:5-formyltetrahydrofolate cyclo-ligase [Myxococcota bacterium]